MFERILMPMDGSQIAEMAIPYGKELGRKFGSEVILYHVHEQKHEQHDRMHQVYLDWLADNMKHEMEKDQPKGTEVRVTTKIGAGDPPGNICNFVEKNNIGLIIMTAFGNSSPRLAKTLGSVADHVCRTVPIPIMLIRPNSAQVIEGKKRLINRILLPVDGSDFSKRVLPVTEELADKLKVSITLFQMAQMIHHAGSDASMTEFNKFNEGEAQRVRGEMIALEKELRDKSLTVTHRVTSGNDAANEIIEAGKEVDADLVVMSTHGRTGLSRWIMGSVTEKILRYGEVPLLLINARANT